MSPLKRVAFALVVLALVGVAAARLTVFRPNLTPAERGRRLAEENGCFACHGPEGTRGAGNPGRDEKTVPSYHALMMFAKNSGEVREWIRDGASAARAKSASWRAARRAGVLRMPAYGRRLSGREIDDLVAFVMAVAGDPAPQDSLAQSGLDRASALGCTGCHGEGGRFARRNPGSLKGYVPPWDGADFSELVQDRSEFDEWVERGVSLRFEANPAAKFFLRRARLRMPAYKSHLEPGDLDALWAYIQWLRSGSRGDGT
jgi:mono/diheme cytochrome c family protein